MYGRPYRQVEVRREGDQEQSCTLQRDPQVPQLAPVNQPYEQGSGGQKQPTRQMVGQRQAHREAREQQVPIVSGVSPEQEQEHNESHEKSVQSVDLRYHGLRPEVSAEP